MLRTTNHFVKVRLEDHALANFWPENYGRGETMQNLRKQLDSMRYGGRSIYQTALDYVEGGSYLVYYHDQRQFLKEVLDETDEEAERFSDDKVFRLYCHLMARTLARLYTFNEYGERRAK